MNVLQAILNTGVDGQNDEFLNAKIKISNFVAIYFGFLSIPFIIFTHILIPPLAFMPTLFWGLCITAVISNRLALYNISRLMLSVGLMSVYTWYECNIQPNQQPLISSFYSLHLSFLIPSWLIFDKRENVLLTFSVLTSVLITLFLPVINNWFNFDVHPDVIQSFKDGWLSYLLYATAVTAFSGGLFFLVQQNYNSEINKDLQLEKTRQATLQLMENEKENKRYLADLSQAKEEDAKRNWTSSGLAEFSLLLQLNNDNIQSNFDKVISRLIKYIRANQGGIFILNDDNDLELISMYAYERKKHKQKIIAVGDGLVGQAVLEKQVVYLTQIPVSYIHITSGLGDAPPTCILIVPLLIHDKVYGVIEIASFSELAEFEIDFVEEVGKNMASTIAQFKSTSNTKMLLEKFKTQAQELNSQKEEMLQNMEELESIQEEMIRKEKEYLKKINDLEGALKA